MCADKPAGLVSSGRAEAFTSRKETLHLPLRGRHLMPPVSAVSLANAKLTHVSRESHSSALSPLILWGRLKPAAAARRDGFFGLWRLFFIPEVCYSLLRLSASVIVQPRPVASSCPPSSPSRFQLSNGASVLKSVPMETDYVVDLWVSSSGRDIQ